MYIFLSRVAPVRGTRKRGHGLLRMSATYMDCCAFLREEDTKNMEGMGKAERSKARERGVEN